MQHGPAREALAAVLTQEGFGARAVALCQAAALADHPILAELGTRALRAAAELPADSIGPGAVDRSTAAVPDRAKQAAAQLAPLVVAHPQQTGLQLACLYALCELWPHCNRQEHLELRRRFINGVSSRSAEAGSYVVGEELSSWLRKQPTAHDIDQSALLALSEMLEQSDARRAYHKLAMFLHPSTDLASITAALGVLADQVLLHRFDRHGVIQQAQLGATSVHRLRNAIPPDQMVVLICQLGHQIWWCRHHGHPHSLRRGTAEDDPSLAEAIRLGNYTGAQRAARRLSAEPERFWRCAEELTRAAIEAHYPSWPRALAALALTASRTEQSSLAPDQAAALGASLAATTWLARFEANE